MYRAKFKIPALFLILVIFIISCSTDNRTSNYKSLHSERNVNKNCSDSTTVLEDDYKIQIISDLLCDSLDVSETPWFFMPFSNQTIKLYYQGKLILEREHQSKKEEVVNRLNQKVDILENVIVEIGIIPGRQEKLFYINGYGGCTDCTEYLELFDRSGKSFYVSYFDKKDAFIKKGDLQEVLFRFGINDQKFSRGEFSKKRVEPK